MQEKLENQLQIFNNEKFGSVRIAMVDDKPYFCGSDVAKTLGYSNPQKAIRDHCKKAIMIWVNDSLGREQETKFIPESDVYRLIIKSKLPEAQKVEEWLFEEVLPCVNKYGLYATDNMLEKMLNDPDTMITVLTKLKEEKEKVKQLKQENEIMKPKSDYYDCLVEKTLSTGFRDTAKEFGLKQKQFIDFLLERKIIFRNKKKELRPYSKYINNNYFELKETYNIELDKTFVQTLITVEGKSYIMKLLEKYNII